MVTLLEGERELEASQFVYGQRYVDRANALAIDPDTGKAYMHVDECWYCGPCAARCPVDAVTINIPYLLR